MIRTSAVVTGLASLGTALLILSSVRADSPATVQISTAPAVHVSTSAAIIASTSSAVRASPAPAVKTSTVTGNRIEFDQLTGFATVDGNATVMTSTGTLKADSIHINMRSKTGRAEGHVSMEQKSSSSTLTGTKADYDWATGTGTVSDAVGVNPPWRYKAKNLQEIAPGVYDLGNGYVTSCDLDPPHYAFRARRAHVIRGKRAKLYGSRLELGDTPVLWSPYYTRSLVPKKYSLRIEPGHTSRDGETVTTILGYPFTANSYTKFKWDYVGATGNGAGIEHRYFSPNIKGDFDSYYIHDINPDPLPQERRYKVLWTHYQRFTPHLTANGKIDFQSDQSFNNTFNGVGDPERVQNQVSGVLSEGGFNYQFPRSSIQALFNRQDKFDSSISSRSFVGAVTFPQLTYQTIPLSWKKWPIYTSLNFTYLNAASRDTPLEKLDYRSTATGSLQEKKDFKIGKSATITPRASYSEAWQNYDVSVTTTTRDVYVGRYSVGSDYRQRLTRKLDATFGYTYGGRFEPNRTTIDERSTDRGVETNQFSTSFVATLGRSTRLQLTSGYTLLRSPRDAPQTYAFRNARIVSPSLDLQLQLRKNVNVFYRETYSVFDTSLQKTVYRPLNSSGEVQVGDIAKNTFFSQGFSYTQPVPFTDSTLNLTNKLKFYLTPKWYVDLYVSYQFVGPTRLNYRFAKGVEKSISVARDLHCWIFRATYSDRPGVRESHFYIDLKANLTSAKSEFAADKNLSYYPYMDPQRGIENVFPDENGKKPPVQSDAPIGPAKTSVSPASVP